MKVFAIKKRSVIFLGITIFLMISPLLNLNYSIKSNVFNLFPGVVQILGISSSNVIPSYPLQSINQNVKTESVPENFPFNVVGNTLYYEWQVFNGTGKITWDGSTLKPTVINVATTNEGLDVTLLFDFNTYEWTISAIYLGFAIPVVF